MNEWRRRLKYLFVSYLALLLGHHIYRNFRPPQVTHPRGRAVSVKAVDGDEYLKRTILLSFIEHGDKQHPPLVLLHGSPGHARDFQRLVPLLEKDFHLLIPDLPGFGESTRDVPDYSFRAHARYVLELLDELQIRRAHLLGFSMGGGVALSLADIAPERAASITLLAAIGVQEMELLGDYQLNHAVHGLQLAGLWSLRELTPHFGYFDDSMLSVAYARNFYDSDQRPLRDVLRRYAGPLSIIHGKHDFLVPVQAAIEHHRLAPQSEITLFDDDHFMVFSDAAKLAPLIIDFVQRADAGRAATRAVASPARIAAAAQPLDPANLPRAMGVTALVVLLLLAAATLVSEDLTCIGAGVLAAQGRISFALGAGACLLGIYVGDLLLFLAGRWLGRPATERAPLRWFVKEADVQRGSAWFNRRGAWVIFASRFVPGMRLPTYFAAGVLRTSCWKFAGYFLLAAAAWTPLLVWLSMRLGAEVITSTVLGGQGLLVKGVMAGAAVLLVIKLLLRLATFRGRRLLLSSWRRLTRWEFWPMWAFYPPVVCYIGWLALKHRGLTVFTAANPAIPGGGFVGESKAQIMRGLGRAGEHLPRWTLIDASADAGERCAQARAFIAAHGLTLPVVLKPDAGQRGAGVALVRTEAEIDDYFRGSAGDTIIQEYADGLEFGVFYYRYPDEERGRIFALTEKRFPIVVGDGASTLERLILQDERAVCMARFQLDRHRARLDEVPRAGERVPLVELGTHSRGSLFLDGGRLQTDALAAAIDGISRAFDGFYFGRFDLRVPSLEEFQQGRNLKIIELNGVTSEATSIYDPQNSLWTAYRILFAQWRIAFELGARNRARGVYVASGRELLRQWLAYRRTAQTHWRG